ncbi:interleukin-15-like isoform X2 [Hypanus sabinus]|uniref:interleukin-15-like isoform X2 n=1 Tax=Hypanus sabinus TaxID=79690 RepID=UPI0028C4DA4E|nr:interleukin-15-like isoform X2 [Hypanus sabinus]
MSTLFCIFVLSLTTLSLMRFTLFTQRRQVKRIYFNYYHHLNLDCHIFTFINTETGISLLLLCLAMCLPKADGADSHRARKVKRSAELEEILKVLKNIHNQVVNLSCDNLKIKTTSEVSELRLYTPADVTDDCLETAFKCFISELFVVDYEYKLDCPEIAALGIIFTNANGYNKRAEGCTTCEEFQEKSVREFLKAFEDLVQRNLKKKQ